MFKTQEMTHLCQNDDTFFCSNLYRSVEIAVFTEPKNDHKKTITYSKLQGITKITATNHVPETLQQQHLVNTSTKPEGCNLSNFICKYGFRMANEPLRVQQPLLECSSEVDKIRCITNTAHSPVTKITVMGTNFPSSEF